MPVGSCRDSFCARAKPPFAPMTAIAPQKPRWRGFSHKWSFVASLPIGALFVAAQGGRALVAAFVYASCVSFMFGASALYHRVNWSPKVEPSMMQVDKTGIYLMIAGTFTPVVSVGISGRFSNALLATVWVLTAILIANLWMPWTPPYGLVTASYIGVGWLGLLAVPGMWTQVGPTFTFMILGGGLLFTIGGILLALRKPRLWPTTFGYHELWHVLVIAGATIHFVALLVYVF